MTTGVAGAFEFVDGGRTYTCRVEAPHDGRSDAWWWFQVSGDQARYAPFRAAADDTADSVRPRVLAYYEDRLARRGVPWQDRGDDAPASDAPRDDPPGRRAPALRPGRGLLDGARRAAAGAAARGPSPPRRRRGCRRERGGGRGA
jgi:hypothetical protein